MSRGPSRNIYEGNMDKVKGDRFEDGRRGWVGQGGVVESKWRQFYLNNNKIIIIIKTQS